MVLLKDPRYRALLERYMEFHRSVWAQLDDSQLESPLENLPSLYQTWGTLEVIDALLEVAGDDGFQRRYQKIAYREPGALFVRILRDGKHALELLHPETGVQLALTPERTFGRGGDPRSISFGQRPDIVVEARHPDGHVDLVLFDPKYKLDADDEGSGTPVKSDVDKMHAYRDAIRDASGRHLVSFAATLYPGKTVHYGSDLAAINAVPGKSQELRAEVQRVLRRLIRTGGTSLQAAVP